MNERQFILPFLKSSQNTQNRKTYTDQNTSIKILDFKNYKVEKDNLYFLDLISKYIKASNLPKK